MRQAWTVHIILYSYFQIASSPYIVLLKFLQHSFVNDFDAKHLSSLVDGTPVTALCNLCKDVKPFLSVSICYQLKRWLSCTFLMLVSNQVSFLSNCHFLVLWFSIYTWIGYCLDMFLCVLSTFSEICLLFALLKSDKDLVSPCQVHVQG